MSQPWAWTGVCMTSQWVAGSSRVCVWRTRWCCVERCCGASIRVCSCKLPPKSRPVGMVCATAPLRERGSWEASGSRQALQAGGRACIGWCGALLNRFTGSFAIIRLWCHPRAAGLAPVGCNAPRASRGGIKRIISAIYSALVAISGSGAQRTPGGQGAPHCSLARGRRPAFPPCRPQRRSRRSSKSSRGS